MATDYGLLEARVHGQDVLLHQLHGTGPLRDLFVEVVGQPRSLQLQLRGLERRLRVRL